MLFIGPTNSSAGIAGLTRLDGLGLTAPQDVNFAAQGAAIGTSVGLAIAGATAAIPFVGPIAAGLALALNALGVGQGCGPTCIYATNCANATADAMQKNMAAYFAIADKDRTPDIQAQALANFDAIWNDLVQCCNQKDAGHGAGQRCISERQRGGKYDDFKYNRDPIANDTVVNSKKANSAKLADAGKAITGDFQGVVDKVFRVGINPANATGADGGGGGGMGLGVLVVGGALLLLIAGGK